jgi:hypothetical protein
MRILFAIPHFFDAKGNQRYGSTGPNQGARIRAFSACLGALRELFAPVHQIEIVVCTTGDHHFLDQVPDRRNWYTHHRTQVEPMLLEFECQAVLGQRRGEFDYYCFLEDDLIVHDTAFFDKLTAFTRLATPARLLMPNRYEEGYGVKCYLDRELHPAILVRLSATIKSRLATGMEPLFRMDSVQFCRASNPHSACYFLSAEQMEHWAQQPYFLDRDTSFVGPLESAATLGVMRAFDVFKPAPANLDYLAVQHSGTRYLDLYTQSFVVKA